MYQFSFLQELIIFTQVHHSPALQLQEDHRVHPRHSVSISFTEAFGFCDVQPGWGRRDGPVQGGSGGAGQVRANTRNLTIINHRKNMTPLILVVLHEV